MDLTLQVANSAKQSFLDPPVGGLASCLFGSVGLHIGDSVVQERHEEVGLRLLTAGLVRANVLKQVDRCVLGHVECLCEVFLLANVLNRVFDKKLLVLLGDHHDRDGNLVKNVLDEGLQFYHSPGDLNTSRNEFDVKVEAFASNMVGLACEYQVQVRLE